MGKHLEALDVVPRQLQRVRSWTALTCSQLQGVRMNPEQALVESTMVIPAALEQRPRRLHVYRGPGPPNRGLHGLAENRNPMQDNAQDDGSDLASRQAELRKQRDRLAGGVAQKADHADAFRVARKDHVAGVVPVPAEAVGLVADGALDVLAAEHDVRVTQVGVDPAGYREYLLQT